MQFDLRSKKNETEFVSHVLKCNGDFDVTKVEKRLPKNNKVKFNNIKATERAQFYITA